jgi:hypothetical protein
MKYFVSLIARRWGCILGIVEILLIINELGERRGTSTMGVFLLIVIVLSRR